jgi:tRNA threonylcarbamoyladenosine biosynthesis protein TsaB
MTTQPLLLNIDTATEHASICISHGERIIGMEESREQKNHAAFVQPAIVRLLNANQLQLSDIDAVAVTIGPGSYTGLRVGLASAKGICYALNKPLVTVNTLQVIAQAAYDYCVLNGVSMNEKTLFCPLIDARRMEVFTAVYDAGLAEIEAPYALVTDANSFDILYKKQQVIFSGSGYQKLSRFLTDPNAVPALIQHNAAHLANRALLTYQSGLFADLAYVEPLYVKEFFDTSKPKE